MFQYILLPLSNEENIFSFILYGQTVRVGVSIKGLLNVKEKIFDKVLLCIRCLIKTKINLHKFVIQKLIELQKLTIVLLCSCLTRTHQQRNNQRFCEMSKKSKTGQMTGVLRGTFAETQFKASID